MRQYNAADFKPRAALKGRAKAGSRRKPATPATAFTPAIYICTHCAVEHNGDAAALPMGWDKVTDPRTARIHISCPDCLDQAEQQHIDGHAARVTRKAA